MLVLMMLLRVKGDRDGGGRGPLGVADGACGPLVQLGRPVNLLVVPVPPPRPRFSRAATVRVGRAPLGLRLAVAVIQTGLIGPETLLPSNRSTPPSVDHAAPLVVGHWTLAARHGGDVRRNGRFPVVGVGGGGGVLGRAVGYPPRFGGRVRVNRLAEFPRHRLDSLHVGQMGLLRLLLLVVLQDLGWMVGKVGLVEQGLVVVVVGLLEGLLAGHHDGRYQLAVLLLLLLGSARLAVRGLLLLDPAVHHRLDVV